jgi:hypothetical protein
MSTILEALKKSERERKLEKVPTLGTMRPPEESASSGYWILLSSLAVCITAGVIAWLWLGRGASVDLASQAPVITSPPGETREQVEGIERATPARAVDPAPVVPVQTSLDEVVDLRSLPESIASQLPDLTISVISWSEGSDRNFVMMETGIFRVGDAIQDGLFLESIEPDAAIINFMGRKILIRP